MANDMTCPDCGKGLVEVEREREFQFGRKNPVTLKATAIVFKCNNCLSELQDWRMEKAKSLAMSAFFKEIPWDLEKAAKMDGATPGQAFRKVVAPLAAAPMRSTMLPMEPTAERVASAMASALARISSPMAPKRSCTGRRAAIKAPP